MEMKKASTLPEKLKSTWQVWTNDSDTLLLLIKDYVKKYNSKLKSLPKDEEYKKLPNALMSLGGMSTKDIKLIAQMLYRRGKVVSRIEAEGEQDVSKLVAQVKAYNDALIKYIPVLKVRENIDTIDVHTAHGIEKEISPEAETKEEGKGKKSKDEQDQDIVTALNYVGVNVEKDTLGTYSIIKHKNGNGIRYFVGKTPKAFTLSKKSAKKYVDDFLNKPIEARKFMTASQVFVDYIDECEKSFNVSTSSAEELKTLFGSDINSSNPNVYFKNVTKAYSRHSKAWQSFKKENSPKTDAKEPNNQKMWAKRMAINNALVGVLNDGDILSDDRIKNQDYKIDGITKDFGMDIDLDTLGDEATYIEKLEDKSFRTVSALHSALQELKSYNEEIIEEVKNDYAKKSKIHSVLDEQRGEYLAKKTEYEKQIAKLQKDTSKDNTKAITFLEKKLEKVQAKLDSEEYKKANADYLIARNNFRRVLCLSKYYDSMLSDCLALKKEKAKLQKRPLNVDEVISTIKDVLGDDNDPTIKISKGKIELNGVYEQNEYKKSYPLVEIDREIRSVSGENVVTKPQKRLNQAIINIGNLPSVATKSKEANDKEENVDFSEIRGELKNIRGKKVSKPSSSEQAHSFSKININSGASEVVSEVGDLDRIGTPKTSINVANPTASSGLDSELTKELLELLLENKKQELENKKNGIAEEESEEPIKTTRTKATRPAKAPKKKDILSQMLDFEDGSAPVVNIDNFDDEEDDTSIADEMLDYSNDDYKPTLMDNVFDMYQNKQPVIEKVVKNEEATKEDKNEFVMPYANAQEDYLDVVKDEVEPALIPYLVAYQVDGVNKYGNMLERFAVFERYRYLLETKGNILNTFVTAKVENRISTEKIIMEIKYRMLKVALSRSNISLSDSAVIKVDLGENMASDLSGQIDASAVKLVVSDYKEMLDSIDFDILKFIVDIRMESTVIDSMPKDIRDGMEEALTMLGTIAGIIMSDSKVSSTFEKYSAKMKQSYIDTLIQKIESGEIPKKSLDSDQMYTRMLDYLSFSISAQNVIIQKSDEGDGGLTSYPRGVYFAEKENGDNALKEGKPLSYEQNILLTRRNTSIFDDLGEDVVNLFGSLFAFNGANNKLMLRLKPSPLKGGVKFMESIVDILKCSFEPDLKLGEMGNADISSEVIGEKSKSDFDDDEWLVRKRFVLDKVKAREYAFLMAFGMKYGLDDKKAKLYEDFYEKNMLNLTKINNTFKGLNENTISMLTSVIRNITTQRAGRYDDYMDNLNGQYLIFANKMIYIAEEVDRISDFELRGAQNKKATIEALEQEFVSKSEDTTEIYPELTSPRRMVNTYLDLFRFYALTSLMSEFGSDERIVTKAFADKVEEIKREMRTKLIDKIKDSSRLNGYEIEVAKYFELKIVVVESSRDNVNFAEEEKLNGNVSLGKKLENIDIIFAGIRDSFYNALEEMNDPLIKEDMRSMAEVLDLVGEITDDVESNSFDVRLADDITIKCNVRGLLQQYIFTSVIGNDISPYGFIINELKGMEHYKKLAGDLSSLAKEFSSDPLGISIIMPYSSISGDGKSLNLGEKISTVVSSIKKIETAEEVYKALNNAPFYKSAVDETGKLFLSYFKKKKSEQIVF